MQTFTQSLIKLVLDGSVDREVAANAATKRHDFLVSLEQALKLRAAGDRDAIPSLGPQQREEQPTQPSQPAHDALPPSGEAVPDGINRLRLAPRP